MMTALLLVLPVLVPFATAIAGFLCWRWRRAQRLIGVVGATALLVVGFTLLAVVWRDGIQCVQAGAWPAPFGITLVADLFSAIMVTLTGVIGCAVTVYSLGSMDARREAFGYYPLLHLLLMGIGGAFTTGDLFNLYVWFEVMLIASFVLLVLGGEPLQTEAAAKYVTINLVSSGLLLTAIGLVYGLVGTLNLADLARKLPATDHHGVKSAVAMLFMAAFGVKAAVFPLFFWLPASYHTPPVAISAVFAGLLTKVGVYALIRIFTLVFAHDVSYTHVLLLAVVGLTIVTGSLGALVQLDVRRALSFLLVSHVGYMLLGLAFFTSAALAGSVLYIMHHVPVIAGLFLVSGLMQQVTLSGRVDRMGGLLGRHPGLAVLFFVPALSLAGIPPLSGFFAKLALLRAGLHVEQYGLVAVALVGSLLTLWAVMRIWADAFWTPAVGSATPRHPGMLLLAPAGGLALVTVLLGLGAEPLFELATRAAEQLMHPSAYIVAVLGEAP